MNMYMNMYMYLYSNIYVVNMVRIIHTLYGYMTCTYVRF